MSRRGAVKRFIADKLPVVSVVLKPIYRFWHKRRSLESRFSEIYKGKEWGCEGTASGPGSTLARTAHLREKLTELISALQIKTILDAACGDYNWIKEAHFDIDSYTGIDIAPSLIEHNQRNFSDEKTKFMRRDTTKDELPEAELILCRDCFIHLSYRDAFSAIKNFKRSNSKYLLATTYSGAYNKDTISGGNWREINMMRPPFNFPEPIELINDGSVESGKCLGLWELQKITQEYRP